MPDARRLFGDQGEATAARALERAGVRIVARNARTRYGEIDLIGQDRRGWVFVEVKTRRRGSFVSAIEAVDGKKLARFRGLALAWAGEHRIRGPLRLVVAAVTVNGSGASVDLVEVADQSG
jgi:putative endonuclease